MKQSAYEHEIARRKVWSKTWAFTANANDCRSLKTPTSYADEALKTFDRLFPNPSQNDNDTLRRDLWSEVYYMTANANDCKSTASAILFANAALDDYDKKFKAFEPKISLEKA